jgi:hypothetical protein
MGLFIAAGLVLLYWILDKWEAKQSSKDYKKYQEDLKRRGLKYYE